MNNNTSHFQNLVDELLYLVSLDADTYFDEPDRFIYLNGVRAINPAYQTMIRRRRRIEDLRRSVDNILRGREVA